MTLRKFQFLLQKINPELSLRTKGYGDIVGIFHGDTYILRMNKGELYLNNCHINDSPIKRGRRQVVDMLHKYGWIKPKDRKELMWG